MLVSVAQAASAGSASAATCGPENGYEANDSLMQACGPLAGGNTYVPAFETSNDEDWFYFFTNGARQLDIATTTGANECFDSVVIDLLDRDGEELAYGRANANETGHIRFTVPRAGRYYLRFTAIWGSDCGTPYSFGIDPADAITPSEPARPPSPSDPTEFDSSPPGVNDRCGRARAARARAVRRLRAARARYQLASTRRERRHLKRVVRHRKRVAASKGRVLFRSC